MSRLPLFSIAKRISIVSLAVVILLAGAVARPAKADAASCPNPHVVQPGENLFRIGLSVGVSWMTLMQINGISNPNLIYVGETLCLPASAGTITATPSGTATPTLVPTSTPAGATAVPTLVPATGVTLPPAGIFPSITFDRRSAAPGQTINITGINFPTNSTADVLIAPLGATTTYIPVATTTTTATGTVNYAFAIPTTVLGAPLQGYAFSVMIKTQGTGYYGYNFFYNAP